MTCIRRYAFKLISSILSKFSISKKFKSKLFCHNLKKKKNKSLCMLKIKIYRCKDLHAKKTIIVNFAHKLATNSQILAGNFS